MARKSLIKSKDYQYKTTENQRNYAKRKYQENIEWHHQYDKDRHHRRKKELDTIMIELKSNGCAICGYNKCPDALVFHHTDPENKIFGLNQAHLRVKDNRITSELNKCILLCSNCHREVHHLERVSNL